MKRRIILLMAILLISASVILAAGPASINVDLASTEYKCLGQHDNGNESAVLGDYSRQLIEHIELPVSTDTSSSSNYTVTVSVDDFNYQFQPDGATSISKRPYQLDLVLCQQWGTNDPVYENIALNHDGESSSSHSFTIFASASASAVIEEIHSGNWFEQARKQVPFYVMMAFYNLEHDFEDWFWDIDKFISYLYSTGNRLTSAYLDIVLVLPELGESEKNMLYANNNEYKSHIHVTGGVQQEIEISGNYTSFINVVSLNIGGNENTKSINLDPSESNQIAYGEDGIDVGTYSYEIKTSPGFDVAFDAFLSSSNNPSSNNGAFTLTCLNNDANETSITYEAGIRSSNTTTKWFDGTQTFATLKDDSLFNLGSSDFVTTGDYVGGGDIMFRLTSDSTQRIDEIPPGTYTSNIYFHVVAGL